MQRCNIASIAHGKKVGDKHRRSPPTQNIELLHVQCRHAMDHGDGDDHDVCRYIVDQTRGMEHHLSPFREMLSHGEHAGARRDTLRICTQTLGRDVCSRT